MAALRERSPGAWQVRVFTGRSTEGRPTPSALTKRDVLRQAAKLEATPGLCVGGRTVGDALGEWLEHKEGSYRPTSLRDQASRVRHIERDPIASIALAWVGVADVDRWLTRMRRAGVGQAALRNRLFVLRAALQQADVRGWITTNPAALTKAPQVKRATRDAMDVEDVIAVLDVAAAVDPVAGWLLP